MHAPAWQAMKSDWLHIGQDHSMSTELLCPHKCSVTIQLALHMKLFKGNIPSCPRAANTTSETTTLSWNVYLAFWRGSGSCSGLHSSLICILYNICMKERKQMVTGWDWFDYKTCAVVPASAAASGHHLQEVGTLTYEKGLGWVMRNLPCSIGYYSSCYSQSFLKQ